MSKSIDAGNVKVGFDNREFNSAVDESTNKFNSFKDTLVSLPSDIGNGLSRVLSKFNLSDVLGIAAAISGIGLVKEGIQSISGVLGSVAQAASSTIEQAFDKVYNGGMERALNIEQARFQLKGLGLDVDTFMKAANYAVEGTAYGLDSAAKAAAQLGASGVTELEALKKSLRAISGVASMTNSTYDEMAYIFTSVAGTGRVMARQLDSIAFRGLNARAALAKYLNKTEAEIREMTSNGSIDFATFAAAMDDAFGEHAKDANETFTGSLSNIEAALRRIGEAFWDPVIANSVDLFNSIRLALVDFKQELVDNEVYKKFTDASTIVIQRIKDMVDWIKEAVSKSSLIGILSNFFGDMLNTLTDLSKMFTFNHWGWVVRIADNISIVVQKVNDLYLVIQKSFNAVWGISKYGWFDNLLVDISELFKKIEKLNMYDLTFVFTSWFETLNEVFKVFKDILNINKESIADNFEKASKAVFNFFKKLSITPEEMDKIKRIASGIASAFDIVLMLIREAFNLIKPIGDEIRPLTDDVLGIGAGIGDWITNLRNAIIEGNVFGKFFDKISKIFAKIKEILSGVKTNFYDAFFGKEGAEDKGFIDRVISFIKGVLHTIKKAFSDVSESGLDFTPIQQLLDNLSNYGVAGNNDLSFIEKLEGFFEKIAGVFVWIGEKIGELKDPLKAVGTWFGDLITEALKSIFNIINTFSTLISTKVANGAIDKEVILYTLFVIHDIFKKAYFLINGTRQSLPLIPVLAALVGAIRLFFKYFGDILDSIFLLKNLLKKDYVASFVGDVLKPIRKLETGLYELRYGKETFSKVLNAISWFLISIAGSLFVISLIPKEDLIKAVLAIGAIIVLVGALAIGMTILLNKFNGFTKVTSLATKEDGKKASKDSEKVEGTLIQFSKAFRNISIGIILIAAALWVVSKALNGLNSIGELWGITGMIASLMALCTGILIGIAVAQKYLLKDEINNDFLISIGVSILLLSASILLISKAITKIAKTSMSMGRLWGITIMIAALMTALTAIVVAILLASNKIPPNPAGMILMLASLLIVTASVCKIIEQFGKSIKDIKDVDAGKIVSFGIMIGVILGAVVAVLAVIGLIANMAQGALPGLIALDAALVFIAAIIAASAGFIKALAELISVIKGLMEFAEYDDNRMKKAASNFAKFMLYIIGALEIARSALVDSLWRGIGQIVSLFQNYYYNKILPAILRIFTNSLPILISELIIGISRILTAIDKYGPGFTEAAKNIVDNVIFGVNDKKEGVIDVFLHWISELVDKIHNYVKDNIPDWVDNVYESLFTLLSSVADKLDENKDQITEKLTLLIRSIILIMCNTIRGLETDEEVKSAVHDCMDYFIGGIKDKFSEFKDSMKLFALKGIAGFLEGLDGFSIWDAITGAFNKEDFEDELGITPVISGHSGYGEFGSFKDKFNLFGEGSNGFSLKNAGSYLFGLNMNKDTGINMQEMTAAVENGIKTGLKDSNINSHATLDVKFNSYETSKVLGKESRTQQLAGYHK